MWIVINSSLEKNRELDETLTFFRLKTHKLFTSSERQYFSASTLHTQSVRQRNVIMNIDWFWQKKVIRLKSRLVDITSRRAIHLNRKHGSNFAVLKTIENYIESLCNISSEVGGK